MKHSTNRRNLKMKSTRNKQKGVSIVGAILVVVMGSIGLAVIYGMYANWEEGNKTRTAVAMVNKAFDNLPALKETYGTYDGLSNQVVYNSNEIVLEDDKSVTADEFVTPFSTNGLTFTSVDSATLINGRVLSGVDQYAQITMSEVTNTLCQDIVQGLFERALEIRVGTTRVATMPAVTTQCAAAGTTTNLVFISN
ncbi:prokaryotic N- methylation motif domain protein [Vibrio sp. R78045]|uniref:prokaryotic N- methylation motif domain protein n=1 Tax=Vibrio sp. R78045 TaxID=3093868 RepID=UPI0036F27C05